MVSGSERDGRQGQHRDDDNGAGDFDEIANKAAERRRQRGGADGERVEHVERMGAPLGPRSPAPTVDHGRDSVEHDAQQRQQYERDVERQQQDG